MNSGVRICAVAPFVEGSTTTSDSNSTLDVINPSTGRYVLSIPVGCDEDVHRAVSSARRAIDDGRWSEAAPSLKKKTLHRWADLIALNATSLNALDAEEMGKPIGLAFADAQWASGFLRFYAEAIDKVTGDVPTSDTKSLVVQRRVPRGVVAAVTPWNFPTANAAIKLAPALAAGNSVVLKPSDLSSRSAILLAHLAVQAGLPPGVLNVVPGSGQTVGKALGLHQDVDMLTFTGSTDVGKRMLQYSGQSNMKVVLTECGGKSPQLVFADGVDLDAAAQSIARFILTNQGQICSVGSRLLVERSIEDELLERIASLFGCITVGDALDPKTTFGPLASSRQCERVMQYVEDAQARGAILVRGGRRIVQGNDGFFVEPTLFRNVRPNCPIAQEEVFGPVLSVIPFDDEAMAIGIANDTSFGLTAYVWTADLSRSMRVAKALRSSVRVNATGPGGEGAGFAASSEPARQSGIGIEGGLPGLESYTRRQQVSFFHK